MVWEKALLKIAQVGPEEWRGDFVKKEHPIKGENMNKFMQVRSGVLNMANNKQFTFNRT